MPRSKISIEENKSIDRLYLHLKDLLEQFPYSFVKATERLLNDNGFVVVAAE